jgi:hypothetical protein
MGLLQDERLRATQSPLGNESAAKLTRAYLPQKVGVCFYLPKICYFAPKKLFVNAVPTCSNGRAKVTDTAVLSGTWNAALWRGPARFNGVLSKGAGEYVTGD